VILDPAGRVEPTSRVFDDAAPTVVATTDRATEERTGSWRAAGAEVLIVDPDPDGRIELGGLLDVLGKRDVQGVLVEPGPRLAWSFLRGGLADRIVLYLAPKVLGGARAGGVVGGEGFAPVDAALPIRFQRVERIGPDLKVVADVHRDR
jgi:diaminohydroxyphosphoribosylaminopyrimidine deaminase/5-amino-6-(5-phosphoribosylamino)uracil reductase